MQGSQFIENFTSTRILCVGDVMLDRFVRGTISRISPEAPIPILHIKEEVVVLGGAGNVVRNLEALGAEVSFISVVGEDEEGIHVQNLLKKSSRINAYLMVDPNRTTTTKTRFISLNQQILRTDQEQTQPLNSLLEAKILKSFKEHISSHDLVILSDYAKGIFSFQGLQSLIQEATHHGKPVLVDPKGHDYRRYKGATLLTPNQSELSIASHAPIQNKEEVVSVAKNMVREYDFSAMIVTHGPEGMTLVEASGNTEYLPTQALEVFDVSGAGDTVIATLAISLSAGASLSEAMSLANRAAGIVVAKIGTAVVHQDELLAALHHQEIQDHEHKIVSWQKAQDLIQKWKHLGNRIVFTNGCFDLLHPGHVSLLKQAKRVGDRLVVGLNADQSIQNLKGPTRPIQHEIARAFVLSSLESVDLVVLFEEDTPLELIQTLKPDVLVKGADYTIDKVVGAPFVQSYGGQVLLVDLMEGESTSRMVTRANQA